MFPKINNKSLLDCTEEDLQILIDNPDFRENEYLDYKKAFAHLELQNERKNVIEAKKAELKSDICSFANAEGGYLIYGISDEKDLFYYILYQKPSWTQAIIEMCLCSRKTLNLALIQFLKLSAVLIDQSHVLTA